MKNELAKKFVLCARHKRIVHRLAGLPAPKFFINQLPAISKKSHGICVPCMIRLYGEDETQAIMGRKAVNFAKRYMSRAEVFIEDLNA